MTHYFDLEPFISERIYNPHIVSVGWLHPAHSFTIGEVDATFLERLKALSRMPWEPYYTAGVHICELCPVNGATGTQTIWVPGETVVYVAPKLIIHYVEKHAYKPPDVFINA